MITFLRTTDAKKIIFGFQVNFFRFIFQYAFGKLGIWDRRKCIWYEIF